LGTPRERVLSAGAPSEVKARSGPLQSVRGRRASNRAGWPSFWPGCRTRESDHGRPNVLRECNSSGAATEGRGGRTCAWSLRFSLLQGLLVTLVHGKHVKDRVTRLLSYCSGSGQKGVASEGPKTRREERKGHFRKERVAPSTTQAARYCPSSFPPELARDDTPAPLLRPILPAGAAHTPHWPAAPGLPHADLTLALQPR